MTDLHQIRESFDLEASREYDLNQELREARKAKVKFNPSMEFARKIPQVKAPDTAPKVYPEEDDV